jgi:hypothetical protein
LCNLAYQNSAFCLETLLQNNYKIILALKEKSTIIACVPFRTAEELRCRFGEVTDGNNTKIPDLKEDIEVTTMIAWISALCLKCVLNQNILKGGRRLTFLVLMLLEEMMTRSKVAVVRYTMLS